MATQIQVTNASKVANVVIATTPNVDVTISRAAVNNVDVSNVANANYANFANYASFAGNATYAVTAGNAETVDGYIKVPFNFNDASPKNVALVPANAVVSQIDIIITTAFTDPNATLSLGTAANLQLLAATTDSKPYIAGTYAALPGQLFLSNTWTILTINPGSSSAGKGMLVIYF